MQLEQILGHLLTTVGFHLPVLIALGVALVMVLDTPKGPIRRAALGGLAALLLAQLISGLASAGPLLLIAMGDFASLSAAKNLLSVVHFSAALLTAGGFIAVAWALVRALRSQRVAPQP